LQRQYPRDTVEWRRGKRGKREKDKCSVRPHICMSPGWARAQQKKKPTIPDAIQLRGAARPAHLERRDACARPKGRHEQLCNQPQHDLRARALQPCPEMMDRLTTVILAPSPSPKPQK
jgi:hypothetical protein